MNPNSKTQDSWIQALIAIRNSYYRLNGFESGSQFQKYWNRTGFGRFENGKYVVVCDEPEIRDWLADRGKPVAENMLVGILGERVEVEFTERYAEPAAVKESVL